MGSDWKQKSASWPAARSARTSGPACSMARAGLRHRLRRRLRLRLRVRVRVPVRARARLLDGRARARRAVEHAAAGVVAAPPHVALELAPVVEARHQHARPPARLSALAVGLWRHLRRRLRSVRVGEAVPVGHVLLTARVGRVSRGRDRACGEQPPARKHRGAPPQVVPRGRFVIQQQASSLLVTAYVLRSTIISPKCQSFAESGRFSLPSSAPQIEDAGDACT